MIISEAIIQGLLKEANTNDVEMHFRKETSPADQRMDRLGLAVLKAYGESPNNYGKFDTEVKKYPFSVWLRKYLEGEIDLVRFSVEAAELIEATLKLSTPATGGYAAFMRYQNQQRDWLLIVMLKLKPGTSINEETLDLTDALSFDISQLHEAARIGVEDFKEAREPYLSFIKRRGSSEPVTLYFRSALGCTTYTDSKSNTEQAIMAIERYAVHIEWSAEQKQGAKRRVFEYFDEKHRDGSAANLTALSAIVDDQEPTRLAEFIAERQLPINETFEPHLRTYRRLKRISAAFRSVSVSFDVQDVLEGTVDYDPSDDRLIIYHPSRQLIEKITEASANDSAD